MRSIWSEIRYVLLLSLFVLASCTGSGKKESDVIGEKLAIDCSSLLSIVECGGYTVADIADPWGDGLLVRYILVPSDSLLPSPMPEGVLLRTPLDNVVVFSGVHAHLLEELGAHNAIAGVCDARYMYCDAVSAGLSNGSIADCGSSLNADCEKIMQLGTDAVFVLPYENGGFGKLENLGIPLVLCADYMERSPLGCAEWMRFYGRLVGKAEQSDSLFAAIRNEYDSLRSMVPAVEERPKLMCELKGTSAWYVPGGESTMGCLYTDSGADYLFSSYRGNGSVPLSYEVVLDKASESDIWLLKYNSPETKTRESLLRDFAGYAHFSPFKSGEIYACNTHYKHLFEETSFHPEKLLKELVAIFYPGTIPGYTLNYYEKMH